MEKALSVLFAYLIGAIGVLILFGIGWILSWLTGYGWFECTVVWFMFVYAVDASFKPIRKRGKI